MRDEIHVPFGFWQRYIPELEKANFTVEEILKLTGYADRKSVYRVRRGEIIGSLSMVAEVSRRSGKSLDWIFYGRD